MAGAGFSKSGGSSSHGMEDPPKSEFNNLCLYARFEQAKIRERSERDVRREELANCIQRALSTFTRLREHITYVILLLHCTFGFGDKNSLLVWLVYVNEYFGFLWSRRAQKQFMKRRKMQCRLGLRVWLFMAVLFIVVLHWVV